MISKIVPLAKVVNIKAATVHHAGHLEHFGFVAYAGAEVFALHAIIYYISVFLLVFGLIVMFSRDAA